MSGSISHKHRTIVWRSSDREHQTNTQPSGGNGGVLVLPKIAIGAGFLADPRRLFGAGTKFN